jgi:hypothetical protein
MKDSTKKVLVGAVLVAIGAAIGLKLTMAPSTRTTNVQESQSPLNSTSSLSTSAGSPSSPFPSPLAQVPTVFALIASTNSVAQGGTVSFSASLTDQNGIPIASYPVVLMGDGTYTTSTDVNGNANWTLTLPNYGYYAVYATAGILYSNSVTVTVARSSMSSCGCGIA